MGRRAWRRVAVDSMESKGSMLRPCSAIPTLPSPKNGRNTFSGKTVRRVVEQGAVGALNIVEAVHEMKICGCPGTTWLRLCTLRVACNASQNVGPESQGPQK